MELPRSVSLVCGPSDTPLNESTLNENQEKDDSGVNNGSVMAPQFHGRSKHKVHDPARDLSIQVLEKFSLVTKFARETTSQIISRVENQSNGFSVHERRTHSQSNLDPPKKSSNVAESISHESPAVLDSQEVTPLFFGAHFLMLAYNMKTL